MGWNVLSRGLQVVFDKRIPDIVAQHAAGELDGFLARHGLGRDDVVEFLYHPGGIKVLEAYQAAYGVDPRRLRHSRAVLRDFGNMSSVTVLFVIARYLAEHAPAARRGTASSPRSVPASRRSRSWSRSSRARKRQQPRSRESGAAFIAGAEV